MSFCNYNVNIPQHLSNEEFEALKNLSANCNLIIQKTDEDNSNLRKMFTQGIRKRFLMMLQSLKKLKSRNEF